MKELSTASPLQNGSHLKSDKFFFDSSKIFAAQITSLYDFVWPTVTAMWNLRQQVNEYVSKKGGSITGEELTRKFRNPEHKHVRPNLHRSCIDFSWERQLDDISKTTLISQIAYYESWAANILLEINRHTDNNEKKLQFPKSLKKGGILDLHAFVTKHKSTFLKESFYKTYQNAGTYSFKKLNQLLIAYRYFKECRNSLAHKGGKVDQLLVEASTNYDNLSKSDIGMNVKPDYKAFSLGEEVTLSLEGVVGLNEVLLRIVKSIDTEFLQSKAAEEVFLTRVKATIGTKGEKIDHSRKEKQLRSIVRRSSFAKPEVLDGIESFLKSRDVLK